MASFATVSLMRESPAVIERFVTYYGEAGAAELIVYLDAGRPPARLVAAPGLTLVPCDAVFWAGLGIPRPEAIEDRQAAVYQHAVARTACDWALIVDADEFVFGNESIGAFLDRVPDDVDALGLPTAEAVWGPGDDIGAPFGSSYFRLAWRSERLWQAMRLAIYGDVARFMHLGLMGHSAGKEFVRARRRYDRIGPHEAERDGMVVTRPARTIERRMRSMYLGHYDAIGYDRWREKWRVRIEKETLARNMSEARAGQMGLIADRLGAGDAEARALFGRLNGLTRSQCTVLAGLGQVFRRPLFA